MGNSEIWRARACSVSSVMTKVVYFVAEEWVPWRIALVGSCFVVTLSAFIGTPCTLMCSRSVEAECGLGVSLVSSWGPLSSTHA